MSNEKKILQPVEGSRCTADFLFWCPGCGEAHGVWTTHRNGFGAVWSFNGDLERPTFNPSLLLRFTKNPEVDPATGDFKRDAAGNYILDDRGRLLGCKDMVCHSFIREGQIQFLSDCTHHLAGKTVPMEAF